MCLLPEWDLFNVGVVVAIIGFIILLYIIPVYRNSHPKKEHKKINWGIVFTWGIGVAGALVMGFGMSKVMVGTPTKTDLLIGIGAGIIGLLICVFDYPIYSYLKGNKVNCNYYENKKLENALYEFIVTSLKKQIAFGIDTSICYSIGRGENFKFLQKINEQYNFFEKIIPLEHPRFIMQYNAKEKDKYLGKYVAALKNKNTK